MSNEVAKALEWSEAPDWFARIPIDEYETLAGIGYTPEKIAMYYRINAKDFLWYFHLIGSPLKYHYERGQLLQQAREGVVLARAAERGDNATQAQRFDKMRSSIAYKNSISKVFFEDIGV